MIHVELTKKRVVSRSSDRRFSVAMFLKCDVVPFKAWHKSIPSKISCFVWRLFQNRLASKDNLFKRGVIGQGSLNYVGDCGIVESVSRLFLECPIFAGLWFEIWRWFGVSTAFQKEGLLHLEQFEGLKGSGRAFSKRVRVVWFACVWSIWKTRNKKLFHNKEIHIEKMLEEVKVYSWSWLSTKSNIIDYNIAQWCLNPRACLGDFSA